MQGIRDKTFTNRTVYTWTGLGLLVTGIIMVMVSLLLLSSLVWMTALGITALILSFILLALSRAIPNITPEVSMLLLETGMDNIATVVEELGVRSKPVYLPSSLTSGKPKALIPLHSNPSLTRITGTLPQRFIVRYGPGPDDFGLLITTAGTVVIGILESPVDPALTELESVLTSVFVGTLGAADKIRIYATEAGLRAEVRNPRIQDTGNWSQQCLNSSLASVIATITAEAWKKPVVVTKEEQHGKTYIVEIDTVE